MVATFEHLSEHQLDESRQFMLNYWQRLIDLGMPIHEARKVARAVTRYRIAKQSQLTERLNKVRVLIPTYWRSLIELGVPIDSAKFLAEAIAEYDALGKKPDAQLRALMHQHCRFLCRAGLWRSALFISEVSKQPPLPTA